MAISALLVEDDYDLAQAVAGALELEGVICDHAANGRQGLELARANAYDALLVDVSLPRLDGLTLCETLRKEGVTTPILMLTARDRLEDKIAGFEAGTDDYLTKPFEMEELLARIRALSKRYSRQCRKLDAYGLEMNLDTREASREGLPLHLSPTEWKLLEILAMHSPRVLSRARLEQAVWDDRLPCQSSLKVYLNKLRKKVDAPPWRPLIHTLPGVGVALRVDDENDA